MIHSEKQLNFDNVIIDESLPTISISRVIEMVSNPFDQKAIAEKTYNKRYNDPESVYYRMSIDEILDTWAQKAATSVKYGSLNDEYIGIILEGDDSDKELFTLDYDIDSDDRLMQQTSAMDKYIASRPESEEYVCREQTIYYKYGDTYIRGRFDALFYDSSRNKWIIRDWKTSTSIPTEPNRFTGYLLGAAKDLYDMDWYKFTIQTYFYKTALLNSGYLPSGTTESDIEVEIIQVPSGNELTEVKTFKPAFIYNLDKMNGIFEFAIKKHNILERKQNKTN